MSDQRIAGPAVSIPATGTQAKMAADDKHRWNRTQATAANQANPQSAEADVQTNNHANDLVAVYGGLNNAAIIRANAEAALEMAEARAKEKGDDGSSDRGGVLTGAYHALRDAGSAMTDTGKLVIALLRDPKKRAEVKKNIDQLVSALSDPNLGPDALKALAGELGEDLANAVQNFGDDPDYYTGYLAASILGGGAFGKLAKVAGEAGGGKLGAALDGVADFAKRVEVEFPKVGGGAPHFPGFEFHLKEKRARPETERASRTDPSGEPGGKPTGTPETIQPNANSDTKQQFRRQNEAAERMAEAGYRVEHQPKIDPEVDAHVSPTKEPDFRIEGRIFDSYAPTSGKVETILDGLFEKVQTGRQTSRVLLHMGDTPVTRQELRTALDKAIQGGELDNLREIILIDEIGHIVRFYPKY